MLLLRLCFPDYNTLSDGIKKNDRFIDNNYVYLYKKRKRLVSGLFLFSPRRMRYREITRGKKNLLNHYRFLKITQFTMCLYIYTNARKGEQTLMQCISG